MAQHFTDDREIHSRIVFLRNPEIDVTPWVTRVEVNLGNVSSVGTGSGGGDGVVRQAFVTIQNDNENRFSPLDASSDWNYDGMVFDPLIRPDREMLIYTAEVSVGDTPLPGDYNLRFHGIVGDSIRTEGQVVEIECRDLAKRLQERYILDYREYGAPIEDGGIPAHVVMQEILDDEFGIGVIPLYVPVAPTFALPPFAVEFGTVWDWLQNITAEFGWWLGYKYDSVMGQFRLTLLEPPRDKTAATADFEFDGDDVFIQDLDITDRDIRNRVAVVYRDNAGVRQTVTVNDGASQAEFGLRPMQIDETNTDLIKTSMDALNLANFALEDLAGQRATNSLTLPFLPGLDLYDGITVFDPRVSSEVEFYGVESLRHTLDFAGERLETEVIAAGRVIGSHQRWLQMQAREGSAGNPPGDVWPVRANTVLTVAASDSSDEAKRRADIVCVGEDDQVRINLMVNRLANGGQLNLLEGTYSISDSIILNDNITLQGEGEGTHIKIADGLIFPSFFVMIHRDATPMNQGENIRVYDLLLDGNFLNNTVSGSMYGIIFDYVRDSWVQNVRFTRIREYPFSCFSSTGVYFKDNIVVDCGDSIDFAASEKCQVLNNLIREPFFWGGMKFYSDCVDFVVSGNQFFDVNDFSGCMSFQLCEGFKVAGNTMKDVAMGIGLDQGVRNCSFVQNEITRAQSNGFRILSGDVNPSENNIITNNVFVDCGLDGAESMFCQVLLRGGAHRNSLQTNLFRLEIGVADFCIAIRQGLGLPPPLPEQNHIDNNDFLDGYTDDGIFDGGIDTDIGSGNRPFGVGPIPDTSYYTDFTDWPIGETPYTWWGWHDQDGGSQVYTVIEDGLPALYMNVSSSSLWRIWGPRDAPAARNIEMFTEFKTTATLTGNFNTISMWMRVSGWYSDRYGGVFITANGTTFALRRRNVSAYATLDSQANAVQANVWHKVRFRAEGQDFFAKIWQSIDPEPVGWTVQGTYDVGLHETGARIGLGKATTVGNTYFRQFGYAIAGGTAPGN